MMSSPKAGQIVQIWYGPNTRDAMPWHGKKGVVLVVGRARPRNHVIEVGGVKVVVPAGNLREIK